MELAGNNLNAILLLAIVFAACTYLMVWLSPKACRHVSLYFYCRAEALEAAKKAFQDTRTENQSLLDGIQPEEKKKRRRKAALAAPAEAVAQD